MEQFMTLVDISGECWISKKQRKGQATTTAFKHLTGEAEYHRIAYALTYPGTPLKHVSITRKCQTHRCCRGDHYMYGVL